MKDLKELETKALDYAAGAPDLESLLKALEAVRAARELRESENKWGRRWSNLAGAATPLTALLAIFLSVATLGFQIVQFRSTSKAQEQTAETSAWREALKGLSMHDDSSVLSNTVQMESFFGSERYAAVSRSIASMLLPCVATGSTFDDAAAAMEKQSTNRSQLDLIAVAHGVADQDWALYRRAQAGEKALSFADFIEDPTPAITDGQTFTSSEGGPKNGKAQGSAAASESSECEAETWSNPLKRALIDSYNEDTISKEIVRFWRKHKDAAPGPAHLDISGLVLENVDLTDTDFSGSPSSPTSLSRTTIASSNLGRANLDNVVLDHAVFIHITNFAGSQWNGSNWWAADSMDCELARYLQAQYPAPAEYGQNARDLVQKVCKSPGLSTGAG